MATYKKIDIRKDEEQMRDMAPAANGVTASEGSQQSGGEQTWPTYPTVGEIRGSATPDESAGATATTGVWAALPGSSGTGKTQNQTATPAAQTGSAGSTATNSAATGNTAAGSTAAQAPSTAAPGYAPSQNVLNAQAYLEQVSKDIPNPYQSNYDADIMAAYQKIMNRGKFSYDLQGDPMYQQYRDQYVQGGRMAMLDTMGRAQAQTGGYGSSYAQAAGQGAYQAYLQQLNDVALNTYDRAYQRYVDEGEADLTRLNAAMAADQEAYGRYLDRYNQAAAERDYAYGAYQDAYEQDYGKYEADRAYAYETALGMLQNGLTPTAELLAAAGLSEADAQTLIGYYTPKPTYGGYAGAGANGKTPIKGAAGNRTNTQLADAGQIQSDAAGFAARAEGLTSQGDADRLAEELNAWASRNGPEAEALAIEIWNQRNGQYN